MVLPEIATEPVTTIKNLTRPTKETKPGYAQQPGTSKVIREFRWQQSQRGVGTTGTNWY
jgi:hypothetical protein